MNASSLTPRLIDILKGAIRGRTDKEMAAELGLAIPTVEGHWRRLRERYDSSSRTEIVARYLAESHAAEREASLAELSSCREALQRLQEERDEARLTLRNLFFSPPNDLDEHDSSSTTNPWMRRTESETNRANRAEALVAASAAGGVHPFEVRITLAPHFTLVGDNAYEIVGHPPEAFKRDAFLSEIIDPSQWQGIAYAFPTAVAQLRPDGFFYEYLLRTATGDSCWVVTRATFVYGDNPFPISYSGISMNVTGLWPNRFRLLYLKDGIVHDRTPFPTEG